MSQIPQRDTGMCPKRKETESICRFVWMLVYFCACYIIFSILKKGTIDKAEDHSSPETKQRIKAINQSAMYKVDFCSLHIKCRTQVHKNSNKIYGQHADPKLNTTFRPWDFFFLLFISYLYVRFCGHALRGIYCFGLAIRDVALVPSSVEDEFSVNVWNRCQPSIVRN